MAGKSYHAATSAAHQLSIFNRTLDAFAPVTVKAPVVAPTHTVTVSTDVVRQGASLTITGQGFDAFESVVGVVNSDPVGLGARTANADGVVAFTWTVPADFELGEHSVTLTGASGAATDSFTVEPAATTPTNPTNPTNPPADAQCQAISGGSFGWGVKASFRTYITGPIAHGSWSLSGVTESANGFGWSGGTGTFSPDSTTGEAAYPGSVAFAGHDGQLELTIANPRVQITGASTGILLVDVTSKALETGVVTSQTAVPFATLAFTSNVTSSSFSVTDAAATLTTSGAGAFAGFYAAGAELDPVSFSLPLGQAVPCEDVTVVNPVDVDNGSGNGSGNGAGGGSRAGNGTDGVAPGAGGSGSSTTPAGAKCVAQGVGGGSLTWGVKASFRTYVTGPIAHGSISTNGATQSGGAFVWGGGNGAYNEADSKGKVNYSGTVAFAGHNGQLDLKISNPRVQVNGKGSANLIADITSKGLNAPDVAKSGVIIATLALPASTTADGKISWSNAPATLTAAGAEAFGGFYQGGTAMDPVSFSFPLGGEVVCDSATGTLAATGADGATSAAMGAIAFLMLGLALVAVRRRQNAV